MISFLAFKHPSERFKVFVLYSSHECIEWIYSKPMSLHKVPDTTLFCKVFENVNLYMISYDARLLQYINDYHFWSPCPANHFHGWVQSGILSCTIWNQYFFASLNMHIKLKYTCKPTFTFLKWYALNENVPRYNTLGPRWLIQHGGILVI